MIAQELRSAGFRAESRRKLFDPDGNEVGDVDVAVLGHGDPPSLSLVEVKWLLPADSAREILRAYREVEQGREQAMRALNFLEADPKRALGQLFKDGRSVQDVSNDVHVYVASRGSLGDDPLTRTPFVVDIDTVLDRIRARSFEDIPDLWHQVQADHWGLVDLWKPTTSDFTLLGYRFTAEAYVPPSYAGGVMPSNVYTASLGRNDACGCGSTRKFKRCCDRVLR